MTTGQSKGGGDDDAPPKLEGQEFVTAQLESIERQQRGALMQTWRLLGWNCQVANLDRGDVIIRGDWRR